MYKSLELDKNTWNHTNVYKQMIIDTIMQLKQKTIELWRWSYYD